MSIYRGDLEATQAHVVALEEELAALKARHAEALDRLRARQARLEADLKGRVAKLPPPQPAPVKVPRNEFGRPLERPLFPAVRNLLAVLVIFLAVAIVVEHC